MDQEIQAMASISTALSELEDEGKARVLRWAADRFSVSDLDIGVRQEKEPPSSKGSNEKEGDDGASNEPTGQFDTFAELFAQANPSAEATKVLVAGYWHQVTCSDSDITSAKLNKDLKDLGHCVVNINRKFDTLMGAKPQLAIQLKKSGNAKQARKKYKITKAGIAKVEEMLASER